MTIRTNYASLKRRENKDPKVTEVILFRAVQVAIPTAIANALTDLELEKALNAISAHKLTSLVV